MNIYYEKYKRWETITCIIIICGCLFMPILTEIDRSGYAYPEFFVMMLKFSKVLAWWIIPLMFTCILPIVFLCRKHRSPLIVLLSFLIIIEFFYYSIYVFRIGKYVEYYREFYLPILIFSIILSNNKVIKYKNILKNSNSPELKSIYDMKINLYPECLPRQYKIYGGLIVFYFVVFTYCSVSCAFHFLFTGKNIFYDFFVLFFIWSATDLTLSFIYKQKNIYGSKIEGSFWLWVLLETLIILPLHHFYISFLKLIGMC